MNNMKLKFIGADGSLGLIHGEYYNVSLDIQYHMLIARIKTGWISDTFCPYETLQAFAKNWSL